MKGLGPLSRAMLLGFLRDRVTLFFTIVFPLMFLVLFGGLFKDAGVSQTEILQIGNVPVIDQMPADARTELDKVLKVERRDDRQAALQAVRDGDYAAAVEQDGGRVIVHYSAADQVRSGTVRSILNLLVQDANQAASGVPPRFNLELSQVEDESLEAIQFVTPGLLGWAIATGATFGASLTLVSWRRKRILRRLRLSPARVPAIVLARVLVSVLIALGQTAIFLGVASLPYFGLRLSGYWWMAVPLVVCATLAFMSIGLLAGAWAKTEESASAIVNLIVLPMAFLSGSFIPADNLPGWIRTVSNVFPLKHLNDAMLDVMVRGQPPTAVLPQVGILIGFAVVVAALAMWLFRWDDV
ncbi:ABC transporter permease [Virgisporangium aliadipatigenens]|uniref:ABC transporter permease n=1 Tax=Virgisporangium aliadipatigenens TaxID=741659 RepID=UPI00194240D8|nr:ABC transporter permease [Virgisporangium aliadipatigenens]